MDNTTYLTIPEVADMFRTTASSLYVQRHRGENPGALGVKMGRKILFRREDLEAWYRQQQADQTAERAGYGSLTEGELELAKVNPRTFRLYKRDRGRCGICHRTVNPLGATVDHIVPRAKGGGDEQSNLQLAHFICNSRKGTRDQDAVA